MASTLDQIVQVSIDLNQPPKDEKSFGIALIVGPPPAVRRNPDGTVAEIDLPSVGTYRDADEVKSAGFSTVGSDADPVGAAARVGFSQMPAPEHVVIAVQQRAEYDPALYDCYVTEDISNILGSEPDPGPGIFLVAKYPAIGDAFAAVTRNSTPFSGMIFIQDGKTQYCVIALQGGGTATFDIMLPESTSAQGKTILLEYVARWNAEIGSGEVTSIQTVNNSQFENVEDTLDRALEYGGWYGIGPAGIDESEFESIAQWAEAHEVVANFPLGTLENIKTIYYRSFDIEVRTDGKQLLEDIPGDNRYANVAYLCRCLAYQPGSISWVYKTLSGIEPGTLSSTHKAALDAKNANYYMTIAGTNNTMGGKVRAGEWIDVIHFRDWLKNDMQLRIFTLLRVNPKLPFTDNGIQLVKNQMEASLRQGQAYNGIAPDEFNLDGDLIPGFVTSVPLAAKLTPTQKASRVLTDCTFAARLAGAIHAVRIRGALVYELPAAA